ncbi:MFP1 attachment factor 1-like [Ananas comosus]|uniref:MFP1 attachment factor 1-like n=1 Tax=Ananas comosus TaxID=4615 RepID=A0A6P5FVC7_ANACO|nr:MFP1 attachment factor 1-like [Ananas comosus]
MAEEVEDPKPHAAEGAPQSHDDSSGDSAAQPPPAAGAGAGGGGGIGGFSLSIWPPTQRTRDAVIRRLVENLTSSTVLSKRYGVVPADEAEESARAVEREAFAAASAAAAADAEGGGAKGGDSVEEGIEVLHVYSKEISRRLLEFAKSRASVASPASSLPSTASDAPTEGAASAAEVASPPAVGEEASADASEASTA